MLHVVPVCVRARTWWECPQSYHRTKLSCKCFDSRNFLSQRLNLHALEMREFHKEELSDGRKNPIPRDQVHPTNRKLQVSQPSPLSQFSSNLAIQIYFNSHLFPRKPNSTPFPPIYFPTNKRCQATSTSALQGVRSTSRVSPQRQITAPPGKLSLKQRLQSPSLTSNICCTSEISCIY